VALLATTLPAAEHGAKRELASSASEEVRFARRVVANLRAAAGGGSVAELVVAHDGSWFHAAGTEHACHFGRSGPAGRILALLASDRLRYPGRPVLFATLVRAGWPDEAMLAGAAKNRLHVTIARLRKSGLEGTLVRRDEGYLLDAAHRVRVADRHEQPRRGPSAAV
jgi:hypothetical protein